MKLVYVDDVDEYEPIVREASCCLGRWLEQEVGYEFITCHPDTADPLWLREGTVCSERDMHPELHGAKCVPSKSAIDATRNGRDTWYLLDLEFHPHLTDYGLDLALYLVAKGVPPERILIFSAFPERVFSRFTDELERNTKKELPVFQSYRKDGLEAGEEGLAWRIRQIYGWGPKSTPSVHAQRFLPKGIIGQSKELRKAVEICLTIARVSQKSVLIEGESGAGKELLAQLIHSESDRSQNPFVSINSAGIPEHLLESELFGHARGAFTGATQARVGKFEFANHGVLFLDEVGDLTLSAQAKLLRVLQERKMCRLGENQERDIDVRVISATNRDLDQMMQIGTFRKDLFHRLAVLRVDLPPLRQRREDILPLAEHFLEALARENPGLPQSFDREAAALLYNAYWDGNVRELKNVVERLSIFEASRVISAASVREVLEKTVQSPEVTAPDVKGGSPKTHLKRSINQREWLDVVARLKARTNVTNFLAAFKNVLDQVPKRGIDPNDDAVKTIWRTVVAANKEMCLHEELVRASRSAGDGDYGLGIFKLATLLSCINLSQSEKDALAREVKEPLLPDWGRFQFRGNNGNPRNWPQEKKDKVEGIIRAMAGVVKGS